MEEQRPTETKPSSSEDQPPQAGLEAMLRLLRATDEQLGLDPEDPVEEETN